MNDITNILVQIFAPFAGVLTAFLLGISYDRWKKGKDRKNNTLELIDSIFHEIKELKEALEDPKKKIGDIQWNKEDRLFLGTYGQADLPVVESSINSGSFLLLSSELRPIISTVNIRLKHYNWFMEQIISFKRSGLYANSSLEDKEAANLVEHVKLQKENLLTEFKDALESLKTEKLRIEPK